MKAQGTEITEVLDSLVRVGFKQVLWRRKRVPLGGEAAVYEVSDFGTFEKDGERVEFATAMRAYRRVQISEALWKIIDALETIQSVSGDGVADVEKLEFAKLLLASIAATPPWVNEARDSAEEALQHLGIKKEMK